MPGFRLLPAAVADLEEIRDYIADHNPSAAAAMLDRIEDHCRFFARFPAAGRTRAELRPRLHSFVVGRYVVFYRLADNGIDIVRVLHGPATSIPSSVDFTRERSKGPAIGRALLRHSASIRRRQASA